MPGPNKPRRYRVDSCPTICSLNPRQLPAGAYDAIHRWYEEGLGSDVMVEKARDLGWSISRTAVIRHKSKHLVPEDHFVDVGRPEGADSPTAGGQKLSDLQILDRIIQAGAQSLDSKSVRISPEMTLKAMELRLKLTQGSVFDDFMSAVAKAFGAPEDAGPTAAPENIAARLTEGERGEADAGDGDAE